MNARNWTDTLKLLSMMILADEKIYPEEVASFKKAAVALKDAINPKIMLTEHMAQEWFMLHRDHIKTTLSSIYHEDIIAITLDKLSGVPNRKELLLALIKISLSDGNQHSSEKIFIQRARDSWNVDIAC